MVPPQALVKGSLWPMYAEDLWLELAFQRRALEDGFKPRFYQVPDTDPKLVYYYDCSRSIVDCKFRIRVDTQLDNNRKITTKACLDHNHPLKPLKPEEETKAVAIMINLEEEVRNVAVNEIKEIGETAITIKEEPTVTRRKQDGVLEDVRIALGEEWMKLVRERADVARYLVKPTPILVLTSSSRSSSNLPDSSSTQACESRSRRAQLPPVPLNLSTATHHVSNFSTTPLRIRASSDYFALPSKSPPASRRTSTAPQAREAYPTPEPSQPPSQGPKPSATPESNETLKRAKNTRGSDGRFERLGKRRAVGETGKRQAVELAREEAAATTERGRCRSSIHSTRESAPAPEAPPPPPHLKLEQTLFPSSAAKTPTLAQYLSTLDKSGAYDFSCYLPALRRGLVDTPQQLRLLVKREELVKQLFDAFQESDEREYRSRCEEDGIGDQDSSIQPGLWRRQVFRDLLMREGRSESRGLSSQVKRER